MALIYGDLHIHIGRTSQNKPVKITASNQLTLENILHTAKLQKGLDLVGIVDAACSGVLADLKKLISQQKLKELPGGGYNWDGLVVFLGSEVELAQPETGKSAHFLAYFPTLTTLEAYAIKLADLLTNPSLSTQKLRTTPDEWLELVNSCSGVAIAAHAFTPHKGVYGNCVSRLGEMFTNPEEILGLELGLSADTGMAAAISDTHSYPYIANSDAHSLGTIAREFTVYDLPLLDFANWRFGLAKGAGIAATHGMEPLLGKYYRSYCPDCQFLAQGKKAVLHCPHCQTAMIRGVWDRIETIADSSPSKVHKPPYVAHVPLAMLPGIGPKTYKKMIENLGTEIDILYKVALDSIAQLVGTGIKDLIAAVREGSLPIQAGGGGKYGKVAKNLER